jgi:nucleoside-diphosphate-sugar epimerase
MIIKISGKAIPLRFDTSKPEGDIGRCGNYSKAAQLLGWKPFTSMEEGLKTTYSWAEKLILDGKLDD